MAETIDTERFLFSISVDDAMDITVWLTDTEPVAHQHYPFESIAHALRATADLDAYVTDEGAWEYAQGHHAWSEDWA